MAEEARFERVPAFSGLVQNVRGAVQIMLPRLQLR
jgi:hypothetical protein